MKGGLKNSLTDLLKNNRKWAQEKVIANPNYFKDLVNIQTPKFLWIGCSDSRVPPDQITQTQPGEIFIHRNVANLVVHTDMNLLSVIQFAVFHLKIEHIIICGHYGCGGVKAALENNSLGLIDNWVRNIKDVYRYNKHELDQIKNQDLKLNRLIEINVIEQAKNLSKTNLVQKSWEDCKLPTIHGWVYDLKDGLIKELITIGTEDKFEDEIYHYKNPVRI